MNNPPVYRFGTVRPHDAVQRVIFRRHDCVAGSVDTRRIAAFLDVAELPAEELEELAAAVSEVQVEAGAKVITVDDYGSAIYFIEDGYADVLDDGGDPTNSVGPGECSERSGSC